MSSPSANDNFRRKQATVQKYIRICAFLVGSSYAAAALVWTPPKSTEMVDSLRIALKSLLGPALCLVANIFAVANHRLNSEKDIDGSAITTGEGKIKELRATLQNTLEQVCLAVPVYLCSATLPARYRYLPAVASLWFVVGRAFFTAGLAKGAGLGRIFGFAATFCSTNLLLLINVFHLVANLARHCLA